METMKKHKDKEKVFLLVDGNALAHRAYHALPKTLTHRGKPTNALYGFARILFAAIKNFQPHYLAVAFDMPGPTFRHEEYPEYKAKRVKPPQEFYQQLPQIKKLLEILEIPVLEVEKYEADDIIATLATKLKKETNGVKIVILTGDADTMQLVDRQIVVATPQKGAAGQPIIYDPLAVKGKYGLSPKQLIDFKALCGDPSDNIPGVPGIGPKTATALLREFGSIEGIYRHLEKVREKFSEKIYRLLQANRAKAEFSKKLVELERAVPLKFSLNKARLHDYDAREAEKYIRSLGMVSLLKLLPECHRKKGNQEHLF